MSLTPFDRVLVANRGEIAVRVLRGIQELGGHGIAVYSEADTRALHVRRSDEAHLIGPADPGQSYLDIGSILDAAKQSGAEAVHPGYGFLSENADFARAVEAAGLVFIGPSAEAMDALGSKRAAKEIAESAGVPIVPGFDGKNASNEEFLAAAKRIGFPLLVKASAGGGGRGMRLVTREQDFLEALDAGRREAEQAFGDDTMLLEKYLKPSRHVEIQIVGDGRGGAIALGERECSVQRRHQKVLEESPSPALDEELRTRMQDAAVALAKSVRYRNAGTVEFLVDESGAFYFLEVNTRLQVEHPVTEMVTGLDLVHLQLGLAAGQPLEELVPGGRPVLRGHALEARICAEDPEAGFLPMGGRLEICVEPAGPGVRVDSGVYMGFEVPVHYDSMLAKVIVHAPDRATSLLRMQGVLSHSAWLGVPTNVDFLLGVIAHPAFQAGELRTDFLEVYEELDPSKRSGAKPLPDEALIAAALAGAFRHGEGPALEKSGTKSDPHSPWDAGDHYRLGRGHLGAAQADGRKQA
ncbi:MAG: 3-methylcrotonyl-CoA carboxylase [Planctomycetota bacterium]|nr:MAG: 3-methylcrotonyl-CoA carboxylase [Planctomycetota bacterium]